MKKQIFQTITPLILLLITTLVIGPSCNDEPEPADSCNSGISYKLDGNLVSFPNNTITAEIHNDAAIGKFYDIWTDDNGGFYFHSTITEDNEVGFFINDWFTTSDVANMIFLNNEINVDLVFTIIEGANAVGQQVNLTFSGTYDDSSGILHQITDGEICTSIDIVN